VVTGRLVEASGEQGTVELGEGIHAKAHLTLAAPAAEQPQAAGQVDLSSFSSLLAARWKNGPSAKEAKPEPVRAGQVRSFRIAKLDQESRKIELQLV
jgi:small subunit ribosomal protein S1